MKKANCRLLIAGYESGGDSILQNIKERDHHDQIRQFAKNARKAGLLVHGDFIIGLPGETKASIEQTRRLIRKVKPDILQVAVASPSPGLSSTTGVKAMGISSQMILTSIWMMTGIRRLSFPIPP